MHSEYYRKLEANAKALNEKAYGVLLLFDHEYDKNRDKTKTADSWVTVVDVCTPKGKTLTSMSSPYGYLIYSCPAYE